MNFSDLFQHETETIRIAAGQTIIQQGEPASCMYVLMQGEAAVRVAGATLYTLRAGELFGEMALIERGVASADVVAVSDCTLVSIDERRFLFLVQQTPNFAIEVMKLIAQRLRLMNRLVD